MNGIDQPVSAAGEQTAFFCHPHFRDMAMLTARFRRHRYDLHTHPTYVIALVTDGCERVRIGRRREQVPAGTVLVVNPEVVHDGEAGCEEGWTYRTFYPTIGLMEDVARELGMPSTPLFPPAALHDPLLAQQLAAAHRTAEQGDAEHAEQTMLLALRGLILRHARGCQVAHPQAQPGSARRLAAYQEMIEDDPSIRFGLEDFARVTGVTRFQVIRDFKQAAGLTPTAYVRDRRVRLATHLIEHGATLAEAAATAGFADQSHLCRVFRRARGFTPGLLQRKLRALL
ncbi:MAG TPA: AraC family transcriptional regulator [Acetobacteraceae bacterium]